MPFNPPTLTATADDPNARVQLEAAGDFASEPAQSHTYTIERSDDGALWTPVRGAYKVPVPDIGMAPAPGASYLDIPGDSHNDTATTPDHSSLDITGVIDVRISVSRVAPPMGQVAYHMALVGRWEEPDQRAWALSVAGSTGEVWWRWSETGTGSLTRQSGWSPDLSGSEVTWIRVVFDPAVRWVRFYSSTDGMSWDLEADTTSQLSSTLFAGTASLRINPQNSGDPGSIHTWKPLEARVHELQVRDGDGGTVVANPDFTTQTPSDPSFVDSTGKTWSINGNAAIDALMLPAGGAFDKIHYDHEAISGVERSYRAVMTATQIDASTETETSTVDTATVIITDHWLKDLFDPGNNRIVNLLREGPVSSRRIYDPSAEFRPIGRTRAVVVGGPTGGLDGEVVLYADGQQEWEDIRALVTTGNTVLLQTLIPEHLYLRFLGQREAPVGPGGSGIYRKVSARFVEVDEPAPVPGVDWGTPV